MNASRTFLSSWPFIFCQKLSKSVKIWQSFNKNNFALFFESRCSYRFLYLLYFYIYIYLLYITIYVFSLTAA